MNNSKRSAIIFFSTLLFIFFSSFKMSHAYESEINRKQWIPENFDPKNITLLIQRHPWNNKYNEGMKKWLEKEYPWKFEIATRSELQDEPKYNDKKTYPFVMMWNDHGSSPMGSGLTYHDLDGHFVDRSIDKEYPESGYGLNRGQTAYKKIFSVLVKKFKDGKDDD